MNPWDEMSAASDSDGGRDCGSSLDAGAAASSVCLVWVGCGSWAFQARLG